MHIGRPLGEGYCRNTISAPSGISLCGIVELHETKPLGIRTPPKPASSLNALKAVGDLYEHLLDQLGRFRPRQPDPPIGCVDQVDARDGRPGLSLDRGVGNNFARRHRHQTNISPIRSSGPTPLYHVYGSFLPLFCGTGHRAIGRTGRVANSAAVRTRQQRPVPVALRFSRCSSVKTRSVSLVGGWTKDPSCSTTRFSSGALSTESLESDARINLFVGKVRRSVILDRKWINRQRGSWHRSRCDRAGGRGGASQRGATENTADAFSSRSLSPADRR